MAKNVEQLDQVVIRIAGDSGDGMQLTGDRFTQETAIFGNDLATFPNFPAEIRAPAGTLAGVSSFQLHFADHDILTPGDRPDVLVAMNPAALKANLGDLPKGATLIVDTHDFTDPGAGPRRLGEQPARGRHARRLQRARRRPDPADPRRARGHRALAQGRRPLEEHVRARACCRWMYSRPTEGTLNFVRHEVRQQARHRRRPTSPRSRPATTSARPPRRSASPTRSSRRRCRPAPTATSPATWRWPTGWSRPRKRAELPLFLGAYPITPASDILHELSKHKRFGVRTFQAEDEIAGIGAALGAAFGGALAVTTSLRAGHRAQGRDDRAGGLARAAAGHLRHPARRPVHRPADQDRAVRPAAGDVRPQRRGAGADRGAPQSPGDCFDAAIEAARIALTYRTPVFLLSDGYLANGSEPWQVPVRRRAARPAVEFATEPNGDVDGRVPALPARPRDAGPAVGRARHAGPGAPHRRHREGRPHRQHQLRPGQPRLHGPHPAGQGRRHRPHASRRWRSTTPTATRRCSCSAGVRPTARSAPRCRQVRAAGASVAQAHLRHLNPFPADLGDVLARYEQGRHPGDEPRPAGHADPGQVPGRRHLA